MKISETEKFFIKPAQFTVIKTMWHSYLSLVADADFQLQLSPVQIHQQIVGGLLGRRDQEEPRFPLRSEPEGNVLNLGHWLLRKDHLHVLSSIKGQGWSHWKRKWKDDINNCVGFNSLINNAHAV